MELFFMYIGYKWGINILLLKNKGVKIGIIKYFNNNFFV